MELGPGRAGCWARGQDKAQGPEGDLSEAQTLTPGRCRLQPCGGQGQPKTNSCQRFHLDRNSSVP